MTKNATNIRAVPKKTKNQLTERRITDYQASVEQLVDWLLKAGNNIDKAEGYTPSTVDTAVNQLDNFTMRYRFYGARVCSHW